MHRILIILYVLILVAETIALSLVYALDPPAPSDPLSVWLGTLGLLSMVVLLAYGVARRSRTVRKIAELRIWLNLHIFLAFQGFLFVVFHSLPMFTGSRFMWLNPGVINFMAVCVVMVSGGFGRWLFAQVPRTLGGQHMAAKEVEAELRAMKIKLPASVTALYEGLPETRTIFGMVGAAQARRVAMAQLGRLDLEPDVRALAHRRLQLEQHKTALSVTQRVFKWWILLHRPIAVILYILSAMHLVLALMFTPSLRFF